MKKKGIIAAGLTFLFLSAVIVFPVSADEGFADKSINRGEMMTKALENIEEQGYDVSDIRAALESGDNETARELMKAFMDGHKGELTPPESAGEREGRYSASGESGDHMSMHLDRLESQGYDVSEIRSALESGDRETARELMKAFMDGHKGELTPPESAGERGNGRFPHRGSCEGTVSA